MAKDKRFKKQIRKEILRLIENTTVKSQGLDFVNVTYNDAGFTLVGTGCSSAVFRSKKFPGLAVKVYSPEFRKEVFDETIAYKRLRGISFFPQLYLYGRDFLAIEYVEGKSLYDRIIEGIEITDEVIEDVDKAISLAKERGLTPSDVHFKNIIVNDNNHIKLIDLSDYLRAKYISRWDRLKFFYKAVYKPLLKGVRIPRVFVDIFRKISKFIEELTVR